MNVEVTGEVAHLRDELRRKDERIGELRTGMQQAIRMIDDRNYGAARVCLARPLDLERTPAQTDAAEGRQARAAEAEDRDA